MAQLVINALRVQLGVPDCEPLTWFNTLPVTVCLIYKQILKSQLGEENDTY